MVFYAVTNNYLDKVPLDKIKAWEEAFIRYVDASHPNLGRAIAAAKKLDEATTDGLKLAIEDFNQMFLN